MVKRSVDFDLAHQLLLSSALRQRSLSDNLGSRHPLIIQVRKLITLGKSSLTQKSASTMLFDINISVVLDYLLFHYNLLRLIGLVLSRAALLHLLLSNLIYYNLPISPLNN